MVELAENDLGGCKLASAAISGHGGVYGRLKWESGIHRVQRVPVTESGGLPAAGARGGGGGVTEKRVSPPGEEGRELGWAAS